MIEAVVRLRSISPLSQSRHYTDPPKGAKESDKDYEARTWRERCHADDQGRIVIPPMAFKNCLSEAAKYLGEKIPGKRGATYTKHFEAAVLVEKPMVLDVLKKDVAGEWLFVPSNGQRGGSTRVDKCFPVIPEWEGVVTFLIFDETITKPVFEYHIKQAGAFIGLGRFRPKQNGFYGRFELVSLDWRETK